MEIDEDVKGTYILLSGTSAVVVTFIRKTVKVMLNLGQ